MDSVGLNVFIAVIGLTRADLCRGYQGGRIRSVPVGLAATSVPMLLAPLIGKNLLVGSGDRSGLLGGARPGTASVAMVADVAKSDIPCSATRCPCGRQHAADDVGLVIVLMLA